MRWHRDRAPAASRKCRSPVGRCSGTRPRCCWSADIRQAAEELGIGRRRRSPECSSSLSWCRCRAAGSGPTPRRTRRWSGPANRSGRTASFPTKCQHGGGDVLFGEAHKRGQRAIDIDVKGRLLKRLLDTRIGDARDLPDLCQHRICILPISRKVPAGNLQVDWRRHPEIQDLTDDIGGKEGEGRAGKLPRQFFPHRLDVVCRSAHDWA